MSIKSKKDRMVRAWLNYVAKKTYHRSYPSLSIKRAKIVREKALKLTSKRKRR